MVRVVSEVNGVDEEFSYVHISRRGRHWFIFFDSTANRVVEIIERLRHAVSRRLENLNNQILQALGIRYSLIIQSSNHHPSLSNTFTPNHLQLTTPRHPCNPGPIN